MNTMLVGMFDSRAAAEQAVEQLQQAGFAPGAVKLSGTLPRMPASAGTLASAPEEDAPREGVVASFFEDLFGDKGAPDGYGDTYIEAFRRGSVGVTVVTANDDETDKAESILNTAGAIDIDDRAIAWRQEGWTGGAGAVPHDPSTGLLDAGGSTTTGGQTAAAVPQAGEGAASRGGARIVRRSADPSPPSDRER